MNFFSKDLVKDIGISFLIVIAIVLVIMIIFYNKISLARVIPTVEEYELSDAMKEEIEQAESDEDKETIVTYELEASELKQYEKTKEYNKGKAHPFSEDTSTANNTTEKKDNETSTNFYSDDGTK